MRIVSAYSVMAAALVRADADIHRRAGPHVERHHLPLLCRHCGFARHRREQLSAIGPDGLDGYAMLARNRSQRQEPRLWDPPNLRMRHRQRRLPRPARGDMQAPVTVGLAPRQMRKNHVHSGVVSGRGVLCRAW